MGSLDMPKDGKSSDDFATIPDVQIQSSSNIVNPNQVRSGVTRGIQQLGSDKVYSDGGNNQIIVEDDTTPRVLMGNQATFGEGFYVSKPNINVKTNTDPANLIFNSSQDVFKIVLSGTVTIPSFTLSPGAGSWGFNQSTISVPHTLGYAPVFTSFVFNLTGLSEYASMPLQIMATPSSSSAFWVTIGGWSTSTELNFQQGVVSLGAVINAPSVVVTYYVLQETAALN